MQKAKDFIKEAAKDALVEASTEMILQSNKISKIEADQEFITKTTSSFVLSVILAIIAGNFPPLLASGFVFSVVIYFHKRAAEKQAKADNDLADKLWDNWVDIKKTSEAEGQANTRVRANSHE